MRHTRTVDYTLPALTFTNGTPNVDHLPHDTITNTNGQPYMVRYTIADTPEGATRIHHILLSDQDRDMHDHPWDFTTTILHGTYTETTPTGTTQHDAPTVLFRKAETPHHLTLTNGPVWTLIRTGPPRRRWGFHTPTGWTHWTEYH